MCVHVCVRVCSARAEAIKSSRKFLVVNCNFQAGRLEGGYIDMQEHAYNSVSHFAQLSRSRAQSRCLLVSRMYEHVVISSMRFVWRTNSRQKETKDDNNEADRGQFQFHSLAENWGADGLGFNAVHVPARVMLLRGSMCGMPSLLFRLFLICHTL